MKLKQIVITGERKAYLVMDDAGTEKGTVSQCKPDSKWNAFLGIGWNTRLLGGFDTKKQAVAAVLKDTE